MWPLQRDCPAFYGQPFLNGRANPQWEAANLVYITPPFAMRMAGEVVHHIRIHRKVADSLLRVLNAIWLAAGKDQAVIDRWGIAVYGGSYNPRMMRGSNHPSMHAYGCAIDFDPGVHPMNAPEKHRWNDAVLNAFAAEGWVNLPKDHMHFQAARVSAVDVGFHVVPITARNVKTFEARAVPVPVHAQAKPLVSGAIAGGDARVNRSANSLLPDVFHRPADKSIDEQHAQAAAAPFDLNQAMAARHQALITNDPVMRFVISLFNAIFNRGPKPAPQGATS